MHTGEYLPQQFLLLRTDDTPFFGFRNRMTAAGHLAGLQQ